MTDKDNYLHAAVIARQLHQSRVYHLYHWLRALVAKPASNNKVEGGPESRGRLKRTLPFFEYSQHDANKYSEKELEVYTKYLDMIDLSLHKRVSSVLKSQDIYRSFTIDEWSILSSSIRRELNLALRRNESFLAEQTTEDRSNKALNRFLPENGNRKELWTVDVVFCLDLEADASAALVTLKEIRKTVNKGFSVALWHTGGDHKQSPAENVQSIITEIRNLSVRLVDPSIHYVTCQNLIVRDPDLWLINRDQAVTIRPKCMWIVLSDTFLYLMKSDSYITVIKDILKGTKTIFREKAIVYFQSSKLRDHYMNMKSHDLERFQVSEQPFSMAKIYESMEGEVF